MLLPMSACYASKARKPGFLVREIFAQEREKDKGAEISGIGWGRPKEEEGGGGSCCGDDRWSGKYVKPELETELQKGYGIEEKDSSRDSTMSPSFSFSLGVAASNLLPLKNLSQRGLFNSLFPRILLFSFQAEGSYRLKGVRKSRTPKKAKKKRGLKKSRETRGR